MNRVKDSEASEVEMDEARAFLEDARVSMSNLETDFLSSSRSALFDYRAKANYAGSLKSPDSRCSSAASLLTTNSDSPRQHVTSKKSTSSTSKRFFAFFANRKKRQRILADRVSEAEDSEDLERGADSNATTEQDSSADEQGPPLADIRNYATPVDSRSQQQMEQGRGKCDSDKRTGNEQTGYDGTLVSQMNDSSRVHTKTYMEGLKGQDYQVCVTIIEARQLSGLNLDPVVCASVGSQKKYTSGKASTNCPYYNEVYQSKRVLRKSAIVGVFKLDVGTVYAQVDHQFCQKWAVLTDPDDVQSGAKGYLKCTIGVCAKGDTLRALPQSEKGDDDIESNLLLPEGMRSQRQQARYVARIYKAEGLPRLNSGVVASVKRALTGDTSISLLDPYVEIHFAGHQAKTSVQKGTPSPVWNEQIVFTEMFPPLVRRMKFQLRDNAAVGNPVIATHYLDFSCISDEGKKGFLPTFGPCYVNLYGSSGDYGVMGGDKNAALNEGLGEGVFYKGRLLMSLKVDVLNEYYAATPGVTFDPCPAISENVLGKEDGFLLFGCIFDVSMLDKRFLDKPLCLELSMGSVVAQDGANEDIDPSAGPNADGTSTNESSGGSPWKWKAPIKNQSTTPTVKAVVNDDVYSRLPYGDEKPCVYLLGRWPDQRRRLFNSNVLWKMSDKLRRNTHAVLLAAKRGNHKDTNHQFQTLCDEFIQSCQRYLAMVRNIGAERSAMNKLDKERLRLCQQDVDRLSVHARGLRSAANKQPLEEKLQEMLRYADKLNDLSHEPQDSLPDVFLWLIQQNKRIAYHRFSSRDLLFSASVDERGRLCGRMQSFYLKLPGRQSRVEDLWRIHGQITGVFWMGLNKDRKYLLEALPRGYAMRANIRDLENLDKPPPKNLDFLEKSNFELRCHLFQARSLIPSDSTGLSDPFARVVFSGMSATTQIVEQTLNPTWDELLVIPSCIVYGAAQDVSSNSPSIVVELFDYDSVTKREFIGQVIAQPVVKLAREKYLKPKFPPALQWYQIFRGTEPAGELLAAFELLEISATYVEGCGYPPAPVVQQREFGPVVPVPDYIRPSLSRYRIEVLFWGLRDMKRINLVAVDRPRVDIEISGHVINSAVITSYKKNPNFPVLTKTLDIDLPDDPLYWPPLVIRCIDCRNFGRYVLVGTHTINNIHKFVDNRPHQRAVGEAVAISESSSPAPTHASGPSVVVDVNGEPALLLTDSRYASDIVAKKRPGMSSSPERQPQFDDDNIDSLDWWSKYFASVEHSLKEANKSRSVLVQTLASLENPEFTKSLHTTLNGKSSKGGKKKQQKVVKPKVQRTRDNADIAKLKIFHQELENVPDFDGFNDWLSSFDLYRGKRGADFDATRCVGRFKGSITICRHPIPQEHAGSSFRHMPTNDPLPVLVRVYVVKASDLHPSDLNGKADPYVVLSLGKTTISDKQNYISKQLNPVFGKCFELEAVFPIDSQLCIQIYDWDLIGSDDLIGETWIDLENRFYSRHRANCGLSFSYATMGYNKWRDTWKPSQILSKLCKENKLEGPFYLPGQVRVGSKTFLAPVDNNERLSGTKVDVQSLALYALHNWHQVPKVGCRLTPEHIETRALYHPDKPGIVQGTVELWIDMFPIDGVLPGPPVEIAPRKPKSYELRVIIWNTEEVVLEDDSVVTGEKMSDIYVKGCLKGPEDCQSTDVHYRSLTGEGNFNWRFIFPFNYMAAEDKIMISRKVTMFSWDETEVKIPPRLELQVWDADHFSADDFLGSLSLELSSFPRGAKTSKQCNLDVMNPDVDAPMLNIFKQRRVKGWWPFAVKNENGELDLTGKVEAELHLLTEEEAQKSPAGLGRSEPDLLEKPNRPDSSFIWFINPLKSVRYILWHNYKWLIVKILVAVTLLLLVIIFVYSIPGYMAKRMMNA